jgi:PleD family two-component response regulator
MRADPISRGSAGVRHASLFRAAVRSRGFTDFYLVHPSLDGKLIESARSQEYRRSEPMNKMTTVFYVDDNAQSRGLLSSVLAECGFEIITAGDPVEALSR